MIYLSNQYEDTFTFKPEKLKIITDESAHILFVDPVYRPIIIALRYKYLTINEIESEYNRIMTEEIHKQFSKAKEREEQLSRVLRKGPTLYRYVTHLKEKNLVTVGGTRMRMGQIAKELLYCLTANVFYYRHPITQMWESDEFDVVLERVLSILEKLEGTKKVSKDSLRDFIIHIYSLREERLLQISEEMVHEDSSFIDGLSLDQIRYLTETINYLYFLFNPEKYEKEFQDTFQKKK